MVALCDRGVCIRATGDGESRHAETDWDTALAAALNRRNPAADQCSEITDWIMLRKLGTKIAETIEFLLDVPNWLDDKPIGREFEQKTLRPELCTPANRRPRDPR